MRKRNQGKKVIKPLQGEAEGRPGRGGVAFFKLRAPERAAPAFPLPALLLPPPARRAASVALSSRSSAAVEVSSFPAALSRS